MQNYSYLVSSLTRSPHSCTNIDRPLHGPAVSRPRILVFHWLICLVPGLSLVVSSEQAGSRDFVIVKMLDCPWLEQELRFELDFGRLALLKNNLH